MRENVNSSLTNKLNISRDFLLGAVLIVCALAWTGCSRPPEEPAWFRSPGTGKMLPVEELKAEIGRADSLFDLFEMKRQFVLLRGGEPRVIVEELDRRRDRILAERPPLGSPSPEADLLAFDYRYVGPGRYRADYLFRVNRSFPADLEIALHGAVAPEHLDLISEARREEGRESEVWVIRPDPPTSTWREGDVRLLSQEVSARAIPYNLMMYFFDPARSPGQHGDPVRLGWRQGVTESALLEAIERADNLIDLYRLKGDTANLPLAKETFSRQAEVLLAETRPLGKVCDEAELQVFDYRKIGDNRYRADFLFRIYRPFEHNNYLLILYGSVDKTHRDLLSEERRRQGKHSEEWGFAFRPPTEAWSEGEKKFILVSYGLEAQPIPYKMRMILYDHENRRQHGDLLPLGWRADPGRPGSE